METRPPLCSFVESVGRHLAFFATRIEHIENEKKEPLAEPPSMDVEETRRMEGREDDTITVR